MAPEQAVNSSSVDHRADIYSLGCTLYYLLSGHAVFQDGSPLEKLMQHQMDEPMNIRQLRPQVPNELSRVIHRSIAKRPENRVQNCADFARLLQPWCDPSKYDNREIASLKPYHAVTTMKMKSLAESLHSIPEAQVLPQSTIIEPERGNKWIYLGGVILLASIVVGAVLILK
jgi:serine/threonine protein kinase